MVRAIIVPVAGPEDGTWADLGAALRAVWTDTTRCANWMMTQLYLRDVGRTGCEDHDALPTTYLYPEARILFPELPSQSVAALAQRVQALYRSHRRDILRGARSLPVFRYPAPFSMPSQGWTVSERNGRWHVAVRIGTRRWTLRLRGGAHVRRQIARLRQIESGPAQRGDLTLYETPATTSDHRSGLPGSRPTRVMIKIAVWLPKPAASTGETLRLSTSGSALLAFSGSDWRIDAAEMRAVLATDARRQRELTPGVEREHHTTARHRAGLRRARAELRRRTHLRIADACRVYAAQAAAYASRQRAALVEYTDADQSALPHFPWERLRRHLAAQLDERGIKFVHTNAMPARAAALSA